MNLDQLGNSKIAQTHAPTTSDSAKGHRHSLQEFDYIITPHRADVDSALKEVWQSGELLGFLVWRDLKVRYAQAVIGVGWAVLKPLLLMLVFVFVFGIFVRVPTGNVPYSIVVYTGLLPWTLVTTVIGTAAPSLIANSHLLTKVYFPRLIAPLSASIVALTDLLFSLPLLFGLLWWFDIPITTRALWVPLFFGLIFLLSLSVGFVMAALQVKYHDVGMLLPILLQVWMYATPIIYPIELVPTRMLLIYGLNPLVGPVQGIRWALVDAASPSPLIMVSSVVMTIILLVGSILFFQAAEENFADVV